MWLLLACSTPVEEDSAVAIEDAPRLLRRLSLDLRGVLPSLEELDRVEEDPSSVWTLRDAYLDDPLFEDRMRVLLADRWLTEVDDYLFEYEEYDSPVPEYAFERSVGQEPLRLMARIAAEDRDWREIVTADTTMANELIGPVFPMAWNAGDQGWLETVYTDGRPAAGVLSTNGLWWRYYSTVTNYNRGRVAAISRLLVCEDYATRPVHLDEAPSLSQGAELEEALQSEPYCQGCHASLDPAAAALFGFWPALEFSREELELYHPERELQGEQLMEVEMAWMGQPIDGLGGLGQAIAQDPRFDSCTVQSFTEQLWHRPNEDLELQEELRGVFVRADHRLKPLLAAITEAPAYAEGRRLMSPQLLSGVVQDLTGSHWVVDGTDLLDSSVLGYRTLGGGVDGHYVTSPQRLPGATQLLVVQRVAEAAGALWRPNEELDTLVWQLIARRPSTAESAALTALFDGIATDKGEEPAWTATLAALLQDPEFISW